MRPVLIENLITLSATPDTATSFNALLPLRFPPGLQQRSEFSRSHRTLLAEALALATHLDHPVYHCLDPRNRGALVKPSPALGDSPRAGNHDCWIAVVMIPSIAISLKIP